ncbi:MAG TPA: DUF456 domain-containing protein [Cytophagales bacterium]|nr:DUF456 domain-containing protein [Cytophagales bacterium]HAA18255.1 DUF456 domain-containing protein [Cytophagales bacterium]HAP61089.1 DUF456 domain-containing protein [Cytophagales bacterium]
MSEALSVGGEILWIVLGSLFMIGGIVGCFLPVIPGPPLAWLGLLMLQLGEEPAFSTRFMWIWAIVAVAVTALDYVIPPYGTKKFGGTKYGVWGSTIGLIVGIFFSPFSALLSIMLGPLVGAWIGEMVGGKSARESMRPAFGSFVGFLAGTFIKFVASAIMTYYFIASFF